MRILDSFSFVAFLLTAALLYPFVDFSSVDLTVRPAPSMNMASHPIPSTSSVQPGSGSYGLMDMTDRRPIMKTSLVVVLFTLFWFSFMFIRRKKVKESRRIPVKRIEEWGVRKLIDKALYEFSGPQKGICPTVQIVFFHGLESKDFKNAFLDTWITSDDSQLWPKEWISESFENARILSVSYDSNVVKGSTIGNLDLYTIAENSLQNLTEGEHAVTDQGNCPTVMVGKDVGCLVIKEICIQAESKKKRTFLENIKGFVFYCPVLMGLKDFPNNLDGELAKCLHWDNVEISRLNEKFLQLKVEQKWVQKVMMAANVILEKGESIKYIPEVSSRIGADVFYSASEDCHSVCRLHDRTSKSFIYLKDLIRECLARKGRGQKVQGLPINPVGLKDCAQEVEQKLRGASVLGIVGMGGSGKTTLAKQLFNNISSKFEYTCFVDVKQISPISMLDCQVRKSFYRMGTAVPSIEWDELGERRSLIVMDDIDCVEHVTILPSFHLIGKGSKFVLTTRNKHVVKYFDEYIYHDMNLLDLGMAERLFCAHAFRQDHFPTPMSKKTRVCAKGVLEKCDGLPLTLEVVGRYLRDHASEDNLELWKETFYALSKADGISDINEKVWKKLQVSFDMLEGEEKEMFLDVATFFAEEPLETALSTWKTVYEFPNATLNTLVSRSLVKCHQVSRKYKEEIPYIWMHEHLRDLGKKVSSRVQGKLSQANSKETSRNRQLCIVDQRIDLSDMDFPNLKYLKLSKVWIEGTSAMLPKTLHFLRWSAPEPISFPVELAEVNKLAVLEISGFEQVQPSKFPPTLRILKFDNIKGLKGFPEEFGTLLSELEVVEITECPDFGRLPESFGNLTLLQRLHLGSVFPHDSIRLCSLPKTFGQLTSLKILKINAPELKSLPNSFTNLSSLQELTLWTRTLITLPGNFGRLSDLRFLFVDGKLESLPDTFGELSSLQELTLRTTNLITLPGNFGRLSALRTLDIGDRFDPCNLESLPDTFGELSSLQELTLRTTNLITLPGNFGRLSALRTLFINGNLESLPDTFGELSSLQELTLRTTNLITLPGNFGRLSALRTLDIGDRFDPCNLESLPDTFGELSSLQELTLRTTNLITLPGNFGRLSALTSLVIGQELQPCKLESLPDTFGELSSLQELTLRTTNLITLPGNFGRLSALRTLDIDQGVDGKLESLPDTFGKLSSLQELTLRTTNLITLPGNFGRLSALTSLVIGQELQPCKLESLPDTFGELSSLQELTLLTSNLITLPGNFGRLSALRTFYIDQGVDGKLESLPDTFGKLSSLQELTLRTTNLITLPGNFGRLSALRTLFIDGNLESLPDTFGELSSLQELTLRTTNLITLPGNFGRLSALRALFIDGNLESLPDTFGELSSLQELTLRTTNLITLPGNFGRLSALRTLDIGDHFDPCNLESLPDTFGELSSLQELTLTTTNLITLPGNFGRLSALRTLFIDGNLESLPDTFGELSSLQELTLYRCADLEYLPEVGGLSSLRKLTLRSCPKLLQLPKSLGCRNGDRRTEVEADKSAGSTGGQELVVKVENCFYLADNMLRGLESVKISTFPFNFWDVNPLPQYTIVMRYPNRSKEAKRAVVSVEYLGFKCSLEIVEGPALERRQGDRSSNDAGLHISHTGGAVPSAIESSRDKMARLFWEAGVHPTILLRMFRLWYLADVENKEFASALKLINAVHKLDKDDGRLWQERGVLRRLMGDLEGALDDLDNGLETEPNDYEMLKHRAYVKHLLADDTGASADAEKAMRVRPAGVDRADYNSNCLGTIAVQFLDYKLK